MTSQSSTPAASLVIVNDGQYRWAADRAQLLAVLAEQGWEQVGGAGSGYYAEPESGDDEDGAQAYTDLCGAVTSVAGEGSGQPLTDELAETAGAFTFRPDLGAGRWVLD